MKASWKKHILQFRKPAGTSRGQLLQKPAYFIFLKNPESSFTAVGECGLLPGLSIDDRPGYESQLDKTIAAINSDEPLPDLQDWPSIALGMHMATLNYDVGRTGMVWPSAFTRAEAAIPINGLVWMGTAADMREQIDEKLARGFRCIKLKIGAIDFAEELQLLKYVRKHYPPDVIEIRVDANGAFHPADAMRKLDQLAPFALHSIEQPIKAGQWEAMASLCANTPVPIALDEELIGLQDPVQQAAMMGLIKPQGIVLKPSFLGDFYASDHWITLAETSDCIWWITSALESNVGLNAIAQYAYLRLNEQYQGLGTGQLYTNNIDSPLHIMSGALHYRPDAHWKFSALP